MGFLFFLGQLGNDLRQLIDIVEHHAHQPAGVTAVAAAIVLGCCFEHDDGGALLARGKRGTGGSIARADDDYIGITKIGSTHKISFKIKYLR